MSSLAEALPVFTVIYLVATLADCTLEAFGAYTVTGVRLIPLPYLGKRRVATACAWGALHLAVAFLLVKSVMTSEIEALFVMAPLFLDSLRRILTILMARRQDG